MLITDAAVRETAVSLAQSLGEDWALNPEAPADGAAHLIHGDGRAISFRPIFGGATVQLWITGNAASTLPDSATRSERAAHEAHTAARLPEGHRYNKATTLVTEEDEDPAVIILRTLEDHLLPAFEYKPRYVGHRPWVDLFDNALAAVTAARGAPPASAEPADEAEPEPDPEPEPADEAEPEAIPPTEDGAQPEGIAGEDGQDGGATPAEGPESAETDAHQAPEAAPHTTPEPLTVEEASDQASERPAADTSRRPRKRTPKRRPKASTT
ncbi:hypothetical protein ACFYOV_02810 [Streptomyces sp. NPDC005931]|uniref:hypothetical protein n=1 Tax=Streptomyces sp. NPDC005931 TaxID=3364737 RepID=UPI003699A545